jgi:C-terminal processing protease CtpA/Prc
MAREKTTIRWPKQLKILLLVGVLVVLSGVAAYVALVQRADSQQALFADTSEAAIENLRAFAKLYGYVRYFHPSDEASAIDWERFAVHGVRQVLNTESPQALRETLETLFLPIAPTVQIYADGERHPAPADLLTPEDTAGLQLVVWQHRGVEIWNRGPYRSIRLNRTTDEVPQPTSSSFWKRIDATPYREKEIKLQAAVRTEVSGEGNQALLTLYTELPNLQFGFAEDLSVTSPDWSTYTLTGTVGLDADTIGLGGMLMGSGRVWFDDFQLSVRAGDEEEWIPVSLENAGFEAGLAGTLPAGWGTAGTGYQFSVDGIEPHEGEGSLAIEFSDEPQLARPLFEQRPEPGEVVNRPLAAGLYAQIPLALFSWNEQTLRPTDAPPLSGLEAALKEINISELTAADEALRYADVIIAWNVFQHFYPYFDVVDTDWDAVLTESLRRAGRAQSAEEFLLALRWVVAQLDDGHGNVQYMGVSNQARPPFLVDQVEDRVAVVAVLGVAESNACFQRGDVVVSVDGVPSEQVLRETQEYISGSPQWKRLRALREFGIGARGSQARLVLERSGQAVTCDVARDFAGSIREERPPPIEEIKDGIYYVDLERAEMSDIEASLPGLAEAEGIVFDGRGYPNGTSGVLQHLSNDTLYSTRWRTPQRIYPDQAETAYDTTARWILPPRQPRFQGEVVFLTDARALSQAESVLGIVEHYRLGEIVGQPTAGVNGDINLLILPGGYSISWTGRRVLKHDGTQHHLVGIQPTVPVERTLKGIRAGRDEILEQALELIED